MAKYITFFSYTREGAAAMIQSPSDRVAAATALVEAAGGKLVAFYWMTGNHDGFFISDMPDDTALTAAAVAASSTNAVTRAESYRIFDGAEQTAIMKKAKTALAAYRPPTA